MAATPDPLSSASWHVSEAPGTEMVGAQHPAAGDSGEWTASSAAVPAQPQPPTSSGTWRVTHPPSALDTPAPMVDGGHDRAVRAYCREVCPPPLAERAISEIVRESDVRATGAELLRRTRAIAAEHARVRDRAGGQTIPATQADDGCAATSRRLAARASRELPDDERQRLERHLAGCLRCAAMELKAARGERAFWTLLSDEHANWQPVAAGPFAATGEPMTVFSPPVEPRALTAAASTTHASAGRPGRPTARRVVSVGVVAVIAVAASTGATLLGGPSTKSPRDAAIARAASSTAPAAAGPAKTTTPVHPHRRSRDARRTHGKHKPAPAAARSPAPVTTATTAGSAGSVAAAAPPTSPSGQSAGVSAGAGLGGGRSSGGSSGGAGSAGGGAVSAGGSTLVITQQTNLPAQSAPKQGIGSSGASAKH